MNVVASHAAVIQRLGHMIGFLVRALAAIPTTLRHYRKEFLRILADVTWGNGSIVVGGGTAGVIIILGAAAGALVAIEGYNALHLLGLESATGMISSTATTRELAPIMASLAFAAQAGCRFTAQLGAMRISEEIDALEAQAIDSIPYVVSTRLIAAVGAVVPSYLIALALGFAATGATVTVVQGQGAGAYDHYFHMFTEPIDQLYSLIKVVVFVLVVTLVHAYQGYHASGGPEGVGIASGRAIRASLVLIVTTDMVLTLIMWGLDATISFSG